MYPKVCILHYFYFPYRCWYAIHYQTQMDFQNPISLLQFSISLLTFYAWLASQHLGPLAHFDFSLSRETAPLSECREGVLCPWPGHTALSSLNCVGLPQTRTWALEAEPNSCSGGRLRGGFWLWWGWCQFSRTAYSLEASEVSNQTASWGSLPP